MSKTTRTIALNEIIGKTIKAIEHTTVEGADGDEPCINLIFTDETQHGFVIRTDD